MLKQLLVIAICCYCFLAISKDKIYSKEDLEQIRFSNQKQYWFNNQLLDHFSPRNKTYWKQRYYVIDDYFNNSVGPVLLYLCGEWTCQGTSGFPIDLAKEFQALIIVLEHRFYGESQPFGNQSFELDKLKYLTIDQALEDTAYFIKYINSSSLYNVRSLTPWITIGGSYAGAMSAWFGYKYHHLVIGAYASSGVVNCILNFTQFDEQVEQSTAKSGDFCPNSIHNLNIYSQQQIEVSPISAIQYKQQFNAGNLTNGEFLWYFSDIFVELVQYGQREWLCDQLSDKTLQQQLEFVINFAVANTSVEEYGAYYLSNTTFDANSNSRQWTYQYCTQFGWLQTAPSDGNDSMRSTWVNLTMYRQLCNNSFSGQGLWPVVNDTNLRFGGANMKGFNIIYTNGIEDPWSRASIMTSTPNMPAYVMNCNDCAHCADLHTPTQNDPIQVKQVREKVRLNLQSWINQYWINKQAANQQNVIQSQQEEEPGIFDYFQNIFDDMMESTITEAIDYFQED